MWLGTARSSAATIVTRVLKEGSCTPPHTNRNFRLLPPIRAFYAASSGEVYSELRLVLFCKNELTNHVNTLLAAMERGDFADAGIRHEKKG